MLGSFDNYL
jgi:WD40 repeat protein